MAFILQFISVSIYRFFSCVESANCLVCHLLVPSRGRTSGFRIKLSRGGFPQPSSTIGFFPQMMINQSIQNLGISDNFLSFYPALLFASQLLDVFRHFRESSFSLPSLAGQIKLYNRNTGDLVKMWLSASFIYVSRETDQHQVWCQLLQMSRVIVLTVYFYTFLFNLVFRCIPSPMHLLPSSQEQVCAYPLR